MAGGPFKFVTSILYILRVVKDLVRPFVGLNHVIYCDNFYSSGPLVDLLAKDSIFLTGTVKKCARDFPVSLKGPRKADDKRYFVFPVLFGSPHNAGFTSNIIIDVLASCTHSCMQLGGRGWLRACAYACGAWRMANWILVAHVRTYISDYSRVV